MFPQLREREGEDEDEDEGGREKEAESWDGGTEAVHVDQYDMSA